MNKKNNWSTGDEKTPLNLTNRTRKWTNIKRQVFCMSLVEIIVRNAALLAIVWTCHFRQSFFVNPLNALHMGRRGELLWLDWNWNVKPIVHLSKFFYCLVSMLAKTINECENKSWVYNTEMPLALVSPHCCCLKHHVYFFFSTFFVIEF